MIVSEKNRKPRMTVSHVAAQAGVSRAAVYAVLNQDKSINIGVSEKTREKIQKVIDELGYIPNESARTLVSGRSHNIGMILQNSDSVFSLRLSATVDEIFMKNGFMVINAYSANEPERERELMKNLLAKNVDGLILARINPNINSDIVSQYREYEVPVLHIGKDIAFDEEAVMKLAVKHAKALGAKRIGYIGYGGRMEFSGNERLENLKKAIKSVKGISFTKAAAIRDYADCRALAGRIKNGESKSEVVMCYNDQLADLLIHCLFAAGVRVPEDIGIIGIDGYHEALQPMRLTSVRLPVETMASEVLRFFSGREQVKLPIAIQPELIIGESTVNE